MIAAVYRAVDDHTALETNRSVHSLRFGKRGALDGWIGRDLAAAENFAGWRRCETGNHSSAAALVGPGCVAVYPIHKFSLPLAPLSVPFFAVVIGGSGISTVSAFVKALDGCAGILTFQT